VCGKGVEEMFGRDLLRVGDRREVDGLRGLDQIGRVTGARTGLGVGETKPDERRIAHERDERRVAHGRRHREHFRALLLALVLALAGSTAVAIDAYAANAAVSIRSFSFQPSSVSVNAGETVTWTNFDNTGHTATADNGAWTTGVFSSGSKAIVMSAGGT